MKKKFFSLLLLALFMFSNKTYANNNDVDCVEVALDAIDIHEKHFGCLDAETASNVYLLLHAACEQGDLLIDN